MLTVNLLRHYKTVRQRNVNTSASQQNGRKPRKIWIMLSFSFHHKNGNLNLLHQIIYNSQHWGWVFGFVFFFLLQHYRASLAISQEEERTTEPFQIHQISKLRIKNSTKPIRIWANWVLIPLLFFVQHGTGLMDSTLGGSVLQKEQGLLGVGFGDAAWDRAWAPPGWLELSWLDGTRAPAHINPALFGAVCYFRSSFHSSWLHCCGELAWGQKLLKHLF